MNTTMAPLDQIRQGSLGELRQRRDPAKHSLPKRQELVDDESDSESERDDDEGNRGRGRGGDNNDGRRLQEGPPPAFPAAITTTPAAIEALPPTTVIVVSTTTAPPILSTIWMTTSVTPTPSLSPPVASSPVAEAGVTSSSGFLSTMFPTMFPTSETAASPLPAWTQLPDPPDRPRKGLDPENNPPFTSTTALVMTATTTVWTSVVVAQTALASSSASASVSAVPDSEEPSATSPAREPRPRPGQLSSDAEHWLIALAAIGAFILVASGLYFILRMKQGKRMTLLGSSANRKFQKGGPRGWYGWRKPDQSYMDYPPQYYGNYSSDEKANPMQQHVEAYYSPASAMPMANHAADALSRANSQRQEQARQGLLDNPAPFGASQNSQAASPVERTGGVTATQAFYNAGAQNVSPAPEPSSAYSNSVNQNGTGNTTLQDYNNTGNRNMVLSRQPGTQNTQTTSGGYNPSQKEVNHMSYLSSLSSGFGDGLIMPEPTVVGGASRQTYRQSRNPGAEVSRFSWSTSAPQTPRLKGDRDTVYTATSTDSAPRFRTVNSWVANQAGRVDKQQQGDRDIPAMPPVPHPLQTNFTAAHSRKMSEDPAFRHHPGDEIAIGAGSRVPSSILDTKTFVN